MTQAAPDLIDVIKARALLVDALDAVARGSRDADRLDTANSVFEQVVDPSSEGDVNWAFIELVKVIGHGVRWVDAAWRAEDGAERHATAARLRGAAVAG